MSASAPIILLTDRNPNVRELLKREFEVEGYQVRLARDARELCAGLESATPDLVVLDMDAPYLGERAVQDRLLRVSMAAPVVLHVFSLEELQHPLVALAAAQVEKSADLTTLKTVVRRLLAAALRESA